MANKKYTEFESEKPTMLYIEKLDEVTKSIQDLKETVTKVKEEQKNIQVNFVEFLGIVTAVLALVFASTQLPFNELNMTQIMLIFLVLAAILIMFVLTIDLIVKNDYSKKHAIIGLLIGLIVILIGINYFHLN